MHIKSLRLFFGLPLPHRQAAAIDVWRNGLALDGRLVARHNLHLTLAFLGSQPVERLGELQRLAGQVRGQGFELRLDRLEVSRHGLVSLGTSQPPEALLQLAGELNDTLRAAGYSLEERAFWPHLTLARQCRKHPVLDSPPDFVWTAERFVLFHSTSDEQGTLYHPLFHWPLAMPHL
ncbi:RNA 2',3'-cyclic phosphodiesterase [Azotobacter chroococcum]|uniref:RNA 2',3'-cyclic phosphodiesterase n=1 Tax=Azotobacter chroococcum TaxID=353 RepID=UPI0010ADFC12|nr:RNA 2',3'-cyclic phosphodiesterase [Azotobacter chroococcum]TKD46710.1 RNA 2',3'-cyclic phosphodiesterase [Azotobacter chroococcum]